MKEEIVAILKSRSGESLETALNHNVKIMALCRAEPVQVEMIKISTGARLRLWITPSGVSGAAMEYKGHYGVERHLDPSVLARLRPSVRTVLAAVLTEWSPVFSKSVILRAFHVPPEDDNNADPWKLVFDGGGQLKGWEPV